MVFAPPASYYILSAFAKGHRLYPGKGFLGELFISGFGGFTKG
jgi:hypothetical protein